MFNPFSVLPNVSYRSRYYIKIDIRIIDEFFMNSTKFIWALSLGSKDYKKILETKSEGFLS